MNQSKDSANPALGCASFLFSATILGGIWIGILFISDFNY
jgi:hypothetical protein